ncbi:MAG: HAD family hydrolase, partial [Planctomycetota bacterium]
QDPRGMLHALCSALDVPFDNAMLSWAAGPRDTDGVWAPHWYANVEQSTGFEPYTPKLVDVPAHLTDVLCACTDIYDQLVEHRLTVS